ncbi:hypothetical protein O3P69_004607 [Scylla paramamosain]|uniref:Uncharacterized protein n=1 Tax=Scylla paramamosain TaxID=85552 RepID=A0AAW0UF34_SCYPA
MNVHSLLSFTGKLSCAPRSSLMERRLTAKTERFHQHCLSPMLAESHHNSTIASIPSPQTTSPPGHPVSHHPDDCLILFSNRFIQHLAIIQLWRHILREGTHLRICAMDVHVRYREVRLEGASK